MSDLPDDPDARLIPWEAFEANFLQPALGADIPIVGDPPLVVFVAPGALRLGLRLPFAGDAAPDPGLRILHVELGQNEVLVTCSERDLFQPFYALLMDISDRVQLEHAPVEDAIDSAIRAWRRLLAGMAGLSSDEQVGLTGELWTLIRLTQSVGSSAIDAWIGPDADAHDFRIGDAEIEVKTTLGSRREHRIGRLDQLQPSPGRSLWLLSLQLGRAGPGGGWVLADQVSRVRGLLAGCARERRRFEALLTAAGWRDQDSALYPTRWQLRSGAMMIPVDGACPRLTPQLLLGALGPDLIGRLGHVSYTVVVDGLGYPDGSSQFCSLLP